VWYVLSADHGAPEAPEYMSSLGMESGRFDFTYFREQGPLNAALTKRFGRDDLIAIHSHPYLYLNLEAIDARICHVNLDAKSRLKPPTSP